MYKFDLERALAGASVLTLDRRKVTKIDVEGDLLIVTVGGETFRSARDCEDFLFMEHSPEELAAYELWRDIHGQHSKTTLRMAKQTKLFNGFIAAIKLGWHK